MIEHPIGKKRSARALQTSSLESAADHDPGILRVGFGAAGMRKNKSSSYSNWARPDEGRTSRKRVVQGAARTITRKANPDPRDKHRSGRQHLRICRAARMMLFRNVRVT